MADTKITSLQTPQVTTNPATDVLPIVNIADTSMATSGSTRKITVNQLLGAGGTATLASATITGNLTVDTNTFFVDSSSNNVGLGTLTPTGASGRTLEIYGGTGQSRIALKNDTTGGTSTDGSQIALVGSQLVIQNREASEITFETNGTERLRIDSSGNVGIGVTPSAWQAGQTALQVKTGAIWTGGVSVVSYSNNVFYDGSRKYIATAAATEYQQTGSQHIWFTAPSGTAGTAITFIQAMTLDASGNLLVKKTAVGDTSVGFQATASGIVTSTRSESTDGTGTSYVLYSTGASAYRFYIGMGGTVFATNTTISPISSDVRLKQNIVDFDKGLAEVVALRPRNFEYKSEPNRKLSGFIAQEVESVIPDSIVPTQQDPEMKTYQIDWYPLLVKAIQELNSKVEALEAKLA